MIIETVPGHLLLRLEALVALLALHCGDGLVRQGLDHLLLLLLLLAFGQLGTCYWRLFCHLTVFSLQGLAAGDAVQVAHQVLSVVEDVVDVGDDLVFVNLLLLLFRSLTTNAFRYRG